MNHDFQEMHVLHVGAAYADVLHTTVSFIAVTIVGTLLVLINVDQRFGFRVCRPKV